jgi:hypothetical protein
MSEEMQQLDPGPFKICLACTSTPVEGCESMTMDEVLAWLGNNNETLEEPAECGDLKKYIVLSVDHN